jgi:thymidylate synthase ThyX
VFHPSAKILLDSISENGDRLTTMEVTGHRFILAELNTHRAFSRNSASSRAIPYSKMRAKALENTAFPVAWASEQKGMQGGAELSVPKAQAAHAIWHSSVKAIVEYTDQLHGIGVHKSIINRLLEPYLPHTVIVTATDWDGFWTQRCHVDAQPEIRVLAEEMKKAYDNGHPTVVRYDEWHTPLITDYDRAETASEGYEGQIEILKKISVARSARVSYLTHDGKRDLDKDLELYDRLRNHVPAHASPFEHVATPSTDLNTRGNFTGWVQLRHLEGL